MAELLSNEKQDIILMDENKDKLSAMDSNFDLMTVCASPTSIQALKNAGVSDADLFIAVMPEESRNMTACMIATSLGVKKTVAARSSVTRCRSRDMVATRLFYIMKNRKNKGALLSYRLEGGTNL